MNRFLCFSTILCALLLIASPGHTQSPSPDLSAEEARALAQMLQDDQSRQALVEKLNSVAEVAAARSAETAGAAAQPEPRSVPRQVAEFTRDTAESVSSFLVRMVNDLQGLASIGDTQAIDLQALSERAINLGLIILVTVLAFAALNRASHWIYERLNRRSESTAFLGSLALLLSSSMLDALMVAISWAIGYAVAVTALGNAGQMDVLQSLYLNAFLMIEMIKVVLRGIFAPRYAALRFHPMSDINAAYWYHWLGRIVSVLGYGSLVVVPVVNANLSFAVGRSLQVLVSLTGVIMAILVILQNRRTLREHLSERAALRGDFASKLGGLIGRIWHIAAIAYVLVFFSIWLSRPGDALSYMLVASGKSVVAVLLGTLVVTAISRAIAGGLRVPEDMRQRLPLLERRLNAFVPNMLRGIRLAVLLFVTGAILDAWDIFDLGGWLASDDGQAFIAATLSAAAILIVAWLIWLAMSSWVEFRLNPNVGSIPGARERTLLQLLRNALTIVLATLAVMLALSEIGVDIGPLLAGAGVLGLAIGFGAQKLVQDVITGVFIQFENAINEGDVITVGGITGSVERLNIRSVGIRDLHGVYHIVPFSAVDTVSNYMRDFAYHVAAIGVAYREDIAEVKEAMHEAFEELRGGEHKASLLGDLEMQGVTEFADSAVTVRARIKTLPGSQWAVGRAYSEILKRVFDQRSIEIPFPHQTIYWGEDKQGKSPPLRVSQANESPDQHIAAE